MYRKNGSKWEKKKKIGVNWTFFIKFAAYFQDKEMMIHLVGVEYCKMDAGGRLKMPVALKKQLETDSDTRFVIRMSIYGNYLEMFTFKSFQEEIALLESKLNLYLPDDKRLYRRLTEAVMVEMDSFCRIVIPENMRESAEIVKDVVCRGSGNQIELWDKTTYERMKNEEFDYTQAAINLLSKKDQANVDQ